MNLSTLCLGVLLDAPLSGYGLHRLIKDAVGHFQHASFGALYPALGKLEAAGFINGDQVNSRSLGKRMYAITDPGRQEFDDRLLKSTADENFRSSFLSAMYFADRLPIAEMERLIDQKLADHRDQRHHLLALPISSMTEGQRFTVRYALVQKTAAIEFLQGEGRAIIAAIRREHY
jgi:PadR family transcriptional regulator, regulatory protein AphA